MSHLIVTIFQCVVNHFADISGVPRILIAAGKYTRSIVWHAYNMPNYIPPPHWCVTILSLTSYKFTKVILLPKYIIYAFKSYF